MNERAPVTRLFVRTQATAARRPPLSERGLLGWMRDKLFPTPLSGMTTIVGLLLLVWLIPDLVRFLFIDAIWSASNGEPCRAPGAGACWAYVAQKFDFFMYGAYPREEVWRVNLVLVMGAALTIWLLWPDAAGKSVAAVGFFVLYPDCLWPVDWQLTVSDIVAPGNAFWTNRSFACPGFDFCAGTNAFNSRLADPCFHLPGACFLDNSWLVMVFNEFAACRNRTMGRYLCKPACCDGRYRFFLAPGCRTCLGTTLGNASCAFSQHFADRVRAWRSIDHRALHGQYDASAVRTAGVDAGPSIEAASWRRLVRVRLYGGSRARWPAGHSKGSV